MSLGLIVVGINCRRDQMSGIKCRGIQCRGIKCHQFVFDGLLMSEIVKSSTEKVPRIVPLFFGHVYIDSC